MNRLTPRSWVLLLVALAPILKAQVPQLISYQGRVAVGTTNFDGTGQFKFALVDATGATTFWSNNGTSTAGSEPTAAVTLTVTKGLYSVLLGDATLTNMTIVPATVFTNPDVRLRVWFNDGTNGSQLLSPDQRIAAVGYAMVSATLQSGATVSASSATPAVNVSNTTDNPAALTLKTPYRTWWVGQNRAPDDLSGILDNFFIYDEGAGATRLRIDSSGVIHGNGSGLTNLPTSTPAVRLVDGNGIVLGRVISAARSGATVLSSSGHQIFIPFDNHFEPAQIYFTGAGGTGTAYLNDGGGGTLSVPPETIGKIVLWCGSFNSFVEPDTLTNGVEAHVTFTSASFDNPTNSPSVGVRSGWKLKPITRAAAGLPATIALPITLQ